MRRQDRARALSAATRPAGLDERFREVRGTSIRYFVRAGSGVPLVFLHGLGGAAANWRLVVERLAPEQAVLVPDLPGHGASSPLQAAATLAPFADRVLALLDAEAMPAAVVVGHSLGGPVAIRAALRAPARVAGVVLAGAAGISTAGRRARAALAIVGVIRPGRRISPCRETIAHSRCLRRLAFAWAASDPEALPPQAVLDLLAPTALHTDTRTAARALMADDVRRELGAVAVPTLVLSGARDAQTPVADAIEYARRLRAELRVLADCGHLLICERPDECADALERFAAGLAERR